MLKILVLYGIPKGLINTISWMYSYKKGKVMSEARTSHEFEILNGMLQGDILAPYIFIICMDYCMGRATVKDARKYSFTVEKSKRFKKHPKYDKKSSSKSPKCNKTLVIGYRVTALRGINSTSSP